METKNQQDKNKTKNLAEDSKEKPSENLDKKTM